MTIYVPLLMLIVVVVYFEDSIRERRELMQLYARERAGTL